MASFNKVVLVGNITRDIELRRIPSGTSVCDISIAVNERYKNQNGEWVEAVSYFDVTLWARQAETAAEYLTKGSPILIEGKLRQEKWEKDGQKHSKVKVIADQMVMLGSKNSGGSGGGDQSRGYGNQYQGGQGGYNAGNNYGQGGGYGHNGGYNQGGGGYNSNPSYGDSAPVNNAMPGQHSGYPPSPPPSSPYSPKPNYPPQGQSSVPPAENFGSGGDFGGGGDDVPF